MEPRLPEDLLADDAFLRRLSRRLVRDVHAAEDAAQSTWALALARERRPGMPLRAWLAAVLRNGVRPVRRTTARGRHRDPRAARRDGELAASDIVERESARRAVLDVVLELPAAPRAAVLARFYEDLSHRAAARQLGVPLDTYRSQLKRGLQLLRERLDRRYDGETRRWYLALLPIAAQSQNSLREIAHMQAMKLLVAGVVAAVGLTLALRAQRSSSADGARDPFDPPQVVRAESGTSRDEPQRQPLAPARPDGERDGVAPDGSPSGTLVVHVRLVDGRPAPQVGVSATPWLAPQQGLFRRDGVTDAEGMVRLDGVAARRIEILVNPELMAKEVTVEAGEEREVTIALRAGLFRVEGVVVDEQDRPVASAEIWHGTEANGTQGMIVARSAADGTFRLPAVGMYDLPLRAARAMRRRLRST
ncbi:MAG: sigma-70 family RNA polymerase sigma factor [Planctomycetota bacterium]